MAKGQCDKCKCPCACASKASKRAAPKRRAAGGRRVAPSMPLASVFPTLLTPEGAMPPLLPSFRGVHRGVTSEHYPPRREDMARATEAAIQRGPAARPAVREMAAGPDEPIVRGERVALAAAAAGAAEERIRQQERRRQEAALAEENIRAEQAARAAAESEAAYLRVPLRVGGVGEGRQLLAPEIAELLGSTGATLRGQVERGGRRPRGGGGGGGAAGGAPAEEDGQ